MKIQTTLIFAIFFFADVSVHCIKAEITLPKIFSDHMVLQQKAPIPVWGWADPGEVVTVSLFGKSVHIETNSRGKWKVELPPQQAGGPYELNIQGANEIVIKDVLIGEVWVCSGQSNMQWNIHQTQYTERDTAFIEANRVRLFAVHIDSDYMPREDVKGGSWNGLDFDNIQFFSAVAYHFGKYLNQELEVPIGLISSNLGATFIETWMSNDALLEFDQFKSEIEPIIKRGKSFGEMYADFEKIRVEWEEKYYLKGIGLEEKWYLPETEISTWGKVNIPATFEEMGLRDFDGVVWYRKEFDLPENANRENFWIQLLQIDDYDITWLNGIKVGETFGRHNHRNYLIEPGLLKEKNNVLVVRALDKGGLGGFTTIPFWYLGNPFAGEWKYKVAQNFDPDNFVEPVLPNTTPFSSPGVLFNANIAPLTSYRIKGAIWYQGESNEYRGYEYRSLFRRMIQDWRQQWGIGDFPFLFVQLANYGSEMSRPGASNWAELREAQTMALELKNTGMAIAIDVGEADDIHPKDKRTIGERLGISALKVAYGKDIVHSGPIYRSMKIKGRKAIVSFDHTGTRLVTKGKKRAVRGFQIAGEDQQFYWAKAIVKKYTVKLHNDLVRDPVAVRYCWENNPGNIQLYNLEGLPASPFRTDQWPGITEGILFDDKISRF
jgi:sialate O-acetylesterase